MEEKQNKETECDMDNMRNADDTKEEYEVFVGKLCQSLILATGFGKERIYYKKAADYPPTGGDRVLVVCEKKNGCREVCGLYIEEMYENYEKGVSLEQLTDMVLKELKRLKDSGIMKKAENLQSYETAKGDLFIRLLNVNIHKEELKQAVYHVIGDIALVLYMYVGEVDHCATSLKVSRETVKKWNLDTEKVFSDALANTFVLAPPRIYRWEKLIFHEDYEGENFMNPLSGFQIKKDSLGNCLSTAKRTNGAVAIFLPGVARRLGELMGEDYYMVFTSVHEVMIHNASQVEPEDLKEVLKETVRETTPESDFLSLKVYYYDRNSDHFSCR